MPEKKFFENAFNFFVAKILDMILAIPVKRLGLEIRKVYFMQSEQKKHFVFFKMLRIL